MTSRLSSNLSLLIQTRVALVPKPVSISAASIRLLHRSYNKQDVITHHPFRRRASSLLSPPLSSLSPINYHHRHLSTSAINATGKEAASSSAVTMKTNNPEDPRISAVLDFWFGTLSPMDWFRGGDKIDKDIHEKFGSLVSEARSGALEKGGEEKDWTSTPRGTLALLILLDQFPRNLYRGSGEAFSSDAQAAEVTIRAIAKGFDREIEAAVSSAEGGGQQGEAEGYKHMRSFFYLPLMHAEDLTSQVACVALAETRMLKMAEGTPEHGVAVKGLEAARGHLDVVARFGRFPKRNEALGRKTTEEERKYIEESEGAW